MNRGMLLTVLLVFATAAYAHSPKTTVFSGMVTDATDARIVGAMVSIHRKGEIVSGSLTQSSLESTLATNDRGEFSIQLRPGPYEVCAQAQGFLRNCETVEIGKKHPPVCQIILQVSHLSSGGGDWLVPTESPKVPDSIPVPK
jgi:hypothetical protein